MANRVPPQQSDVSFGERQSTFEHVLKGRVLIAKHIEHQRNLYHNAIDFTKALDRVWHDGLWNILIGVNIHFTSRPGSLRPSQQRVIMNKDNSSGCLLSRVLFSFYLDRTIQETLHEHHTIIKLVTGSSAASVLQTTYI